ncbi:MAG: glycosyltransferase family 9 protein [Bacteroidetes bacterium]|nr:MAG: glycosyltransferase family 9 protein [Bacteroidota bacterium]
MKILIIRFSSIGDIVLTTPIIRCIKQQIKNAEVHFITKKHFAGILENNPHIDKLYTIEKNISEAAKELKKENYDYVVDLHRNLRSAQVKSLLGKRSGSFRKLNLEKWLMVHLKINKLPNEHIVDRYFETVRSLGVKNDGKGLDYFIPEKDKVDTQTLPPAFQNGYIGFVIGANYFTKQLPNEKIISICKKLNQPIILLGGKKDAQKGALIVEAVGCRSEKTPSEKPEASIYNSCGKYNLNQSASLVKLANKIITHDTGLMHIAAAFKKEIVSVWGNTIPEFGMYPYYGDDKISNFKSQVSHLSCRPCSKLGYSKCPKGHFKCMNEINEEEIMKLFPEQGF